MRRISRPIDLILTLLLLIIFSGLTVTDAGAQDKASDQLNQVIQHYINLEIDQGLELAQKFIAREDLSAQDSIAGFVSSIIEHRKAS